MDFESKFYELDDYAKIVQLQNKINDLEETIERQERFLAQYRKRHELNTNKINVLKDELTILKRKTRVQNFSTYRSKF